MLAALVAAQGTTRGQGEANSVGLPNEPRIALVIGNGSYRVAATLRNAPNDARAMASALKDTGFNVLYRQNATYKEMTALIRQFGDGLRNGGVGVFYYAGHGMQVRGRNYLIPVDAEIEREDEIAYSAVDANLVLEKMQSANNRLNILILDACRNNPFARSFRSTGQGLTQMEAPVGTLVAFATAPGAVASDGDGENGLYTRHLLDHIRQPGVRVEDVFKNVRVAVRRDSGGKQVPWESTSLEGDFYFKPVIVPAAPAVVPERTGRNVANHGEAIELAFWNAIKNSNNPDDFRSYVAKFPNGYFVELARNRIVAHPSEVSGGESQHAVAPALVSPPTVLQNTASAASAASARPGMDAVFEGMAGTPIKPGDRWEYAVTDLFRKTKIRDELLIVEGVDKEGIYYRDQNTRTDYTGLNLLTGADGSTYSPSNETARFPITVGQQWNGTFTQTNRAGQVHPNNYKTTVVRKERVVVPAGAFDAYYIEQEIYFKTESSSAPPIGGLLAASVPSYISRRIWFSPEIKNIVKIEIKARNAFGKSEEWERKELLGYKLD